jgi:hypothetical protein
MRKHNGMRPQDIVILLKITTFPKNKGWKMMDLVLSLHVSQSEISESLNRSSLAGLIDVTKKKVMQLSLISTTPWCIGKGNTYCTLSPIHEKENYKQ